MEAARTVLPDIADVMMPAISGIDLAHLSKEQRPNCKTILFSGHDTADLLDAAREQGHNFEVLAKPIHPRDLLARIEDEARTDLA